MKREIYIAVKNSEAAPSFDIYAVGKFGCFLDMYLPNRKPRQIILRRNIFLNNYLFSPQVIS